VNSDGRGIARLAHRLARGGTAARRARRGEDQRLAQIVAVQRDIAAAGLDLEAVMQLTVDRSQELTRAEGAMVNLIEGEQLVVRAAGGIARAMVGDRRPLSTTLIRFAIEAGRPVLIADTRNDPRINKEISSVVGERSIICVPFFSGGGIVGSLNVVSSSVEHPLDEDDRQTMELLAAILSAGVSHAAEFEAKRTEVEALARYQTIFEGASIGIGRFTADGHAVAVNPSLERMLGYSQTELARMPIAAYTHPEHVEEETALFEAMMAGARDSYQVEKRYLRRDGETIWAHVAAAVERDGQGRPAFAITMIENITERREAEEALRRQAEINRYQALHDNLTGLPNRTLLRDRIERAIDEPAEKGRERIVLMLMDLDRFKEINDSLGHHAGDAVLRQVASRLERVLGTGGTVARLGGDEFAILLSKLPDRSAAVPTIEVVREVLSRPVVVQGLPITLEASIGVSVYPDDGPDVETLLQHADVAMYQAKTDESGCAFYDEAADHYGSARLTLVAELRRAIAQRELVLHYQPKARLSDGAVTSVEALVRWKHPERGLVPPDHFIPLAQQSDLIKPLTLYVVDEALRQVRRWRDDGIELSVSVNISTRNLLDLDFPTQVGELLRRWRVDSSTLEFEITESTMMADKSRIGVVLGQLEEMGIRLSIDDFGTGYCSLVHLRRLPVREIKIDRSFVMNMHVDADDAAIVRSTVELGRSLGLDVVAEGVECREAWDQLVALGCTFAQGYFLSRPLPAEGLQKWLAGRDPAPAVDGRPAEESSAPAQAPMAHLGIVPEAAPGRVRDRGSGTGNVA